MKTHMWKYKGYKVISTWLTPSEARKREIFPITQVSGICFNNKGKILILRDKNKWFIPGGHPLPNESLLHALKREVSEEACVKLAKCALIGYFEIFFPENPNKSEGKHFYQARYACLISQIMKMKKDPATGVLFERKFVSPSEFLSYIKWKNAEEMLAAAVRKFKMFLKR